MNLQIGTAHVVDVPALALLFDRYRQFYGQASDVPAARAFLDDRLARDESKILLARDGGVVGFTQLYPIFSSVRLRRAWLLNDLYVEPAARGRGVAQGLLAAAADHARATGAAWLMLQTGPHNDTAQRLYERCGWKRDDFLNYTLAL